MPRIGMTVNPEFNSDGDYVGSSIFTHPNDAATDTSGRVKDWEQDYYQDSKGELHHHFSETELMDERNGASFDIDAYQQALTEAIPNLEAAIRWVENAPEFTDEDLQAYNQAFDNHDLDAMNAFYERLMPAFYASQQAQEEPQNPEEESYEDMSDEEVYDTLEEEGVIDDTLDYLMDEEFTLSQDEVSQLETVSSVFEEGSCEHEIANVGLAVAAGEIDMDDAIELVTDKFGDVAAAKAYFKLQSILG